MAGEPFENSVTVFGALKIPKEFSKVKKRLEEMYVITCVEEEMCILRGMLREQGLPTRGILTEEFRKKSFADEKRLFSAREKAKQRVDKLARMFPNAFGVPRRREYEDEFIQRLCGARPRNPVPAPAPAEPAMYSPRFAMRRNTS